MKSRFEDQRLQFNAEAFYYDYKGYQQYSQESDSTGVFPAVFFITVDSQQATFYGAELEATARVGTGGLLELGATGLHARFDKFVVGSIDNTGHDVQAAPDFTVSARYQHTFDLANGLQLRANIASVYVDGHYVANNNPRGSFQSTYTKTAVELSMLSANRAWMITAFARNLEDEAVMASYADPISRGGDIAFLEPPRTYGVTLSWSLQR